MWRGHGDPTVRLRFALWQRGLVALAVVALAFPSETARAQPARGEGELASARGDPMLPTGASTLAVGGVVLAVGAGFSEKARQTGGTETACGLSGCSQLERTSADDVWGPMLLAGGGTMAAGGLTMLAIGLSDPPPYPTAGRARVAAGGMGLALGASTFLMGVIGRVEQPDQGSGSGLLAAGAVTSAVSVPFFVWGLGTLDEGSPRDAYRGNGRIVAGSVLTAAGVGLTAGGFGIAASSGDCGQCGLLGIVAIPPLVLGAACLATGIPLYAAGAEVEPGAAMPELQVGVGTLSATWSLR